VWTEAAFSGFVMDHHVSPECGEISGVQAPRGGVVSKHVESELLRCVVLLVKKVLCMTIVVGGILNSLF